MTGEIYLYTSFEFKDINSCKISGLVKNAGPEIEPDISWLKLLILCQLRIPPEVQKTNSANRLLAITAWLSEEMS